MRTGITGAFGIPGESENGRRVVKFCAERGQCVGNTYFKHKNLYKYTRVERGQYGVEVKSMVDLVLVKDMLCFVQDVRLVGTWIKRRVVYRARRIIIEKLREHQYRGEYARSLEGKRVEWDGENNIEYMWEQVKRAIVENAREMCGSVRVGGETQYLCGGTIR